MKCLQKSQREAATAYHEAGHAVVGRVLGLVCGGATIVPNFDEMEAGFAVTEDPNLIYYVWEDRGKFREFVSVMRGRIMTYMAGREAEIVAFGSHNLGDGDNLHQIAFMANSEHISDDYLERLRPKVRTRLHRHWHKVERVASALLVSQTLFAEQIDALVSEATSPDERSIAKRIDIARQPAREAYLALKSSSSGWTK